MTERERRELRHRIDARKRERIARTRAANQAATLAAQERAQYLSESMRHGRNRYKKGCRCDVCREANREMKHRYRERQRAT